MYTYTCLWDRAWAGRGRRSDAKGKADVVTPQFLPEQGAVEPVRMLAGDGTLVAGAEPTLTDDEAAAALRLMLLGRAFDRKAFSLQRQGRFGTYSPVEGQEASIVGSAAALDPARDWVVPQYRELPALLRQGLPLSRYVLYQIGHPDGGYIPEGVNVLPIQISLAAQLPHAVGLAWGLRRQGSDAVVIVYIGDGASSEGDFHEACNLAGVVSAPVIFLLQNNGWAISTPRERQSAAASLASRAIGYGFPGALVDGNDLLAVHATVAGAVERARAGEGPTLVETLTYRIGAHNTSDDPTRYTDPAVLDAWRERDPIIRVQRYLTARGRWDDETAERVASEIDAEIAAALEEAWSQRQAHVGDLLDHVFAADTPRLAEQRVALRDEER
jgi:pyruvate dehydrogenase E1 component alpha subunit